MTTGMETDSTLCAVQHRIPAEAEQLHDKYEVKIIEGADQNITLTTPEFGNAIRDFLKANKQK